MTKREQDIIGVRIGELAETLGQSITRERIVGMVEALDDVPFRYLEAAVFAARKECKFVPAPVELREMAVEASKNVPLGGPALPAMDSEAEAKRIRATWEGKTAEVKELVSKLPKGPGRATVGQTAENAASATPGASEATPRGGR